MKEFKGTPGPWFDNSTSMKRYDMTGQDGRTVCQIEANDETDDFNFMLAVSAPELLEALQLCVSAMETGMVDFNPADDYAMGRAQSAIAKALGEDR